MKSSLNLTLSFACLLMLAITPVWVTSALADDPPESLTKFVTDDVVGVAFVDLKNTSPDKVVDWMIEVEVIDAARAAEARVGAAHAKTFVQELTKRGAKHFFLIARTSDVAVGPAWSVSVEEGKDASKVLEFLQPLPAYFETLGSKRVEKFDGSVIGATTEEQMTQLKSTTDTAREDFTTAWKRMGERMGEPNAGAIILGNKDTRRVVAQLLPSLPTPFEKLTGKFMAEEISWLAVALDLNSPLKGEVIALTSNEQSAAELQSITDAALKKLKPEDLPPGHGLEPETIKALMSKLNAKTDKNSVVIGLDSIFTDKKLLAALGGKVSETTEKQKRLESMRNLCLAMLNFESASRRFPATATYGPNEKPLLSWRVQILPYIEQTALYKEFKTDELSLIHI